jgi:hypothetical protein
MGRYSRRRFGRDEGCLSRHVIERTVRNTISIKPSASKTRSINIISVRGRLHFGQNRVILNHLEGSKDNSGANYFHPLTIRIANTFIFSPQLPLDPQCHV